MQLDPDKHVVEKIGNFAILGARLFGLTVVKSTSDLVEKMRIMEAEVRKTNDIEQLRNISVFRSYRDFFWATGIDPTKTRPASEALTRRILRGRQLPQINSFVDALNMSSVRTRVPFAAFDSDLLEGQLELRFAVPGECIRPIGHDESINLEGNEIVISDSSKLVAVYPHRDSDETKITGETKNAIVLSCGVPGVDLPMLRDALDDCCKTVLTFCGGIVES